MDTSYTSFVRGVEVDFSPNTVMKTLDLRAVHFDKPSYHERMNGEPSYDEIANDICVVGTNWVKHANGTAKHLKRGNLTPKAKGWYEFIKRSILATINTSEVTVKPATLVHCIMKGGEIKVHELIANDIQKISEKSSSESWLHYPSTIIRLCIRAKVPLEDSNPVRLHLGMPITLEQTKLLTMTQQQRRPKEGKRREEQWYAES
ncbi:hypothetical protein AHAS_Ahas13G0326100 [Arachis hypogaea]